MFKFLQKNKTDLRAVTEKQLEEKKAILESLRDYDAGKKNISTRTVEKHLPGIRVTP